MTIHPYLDLTSDLYGNPERCNGWTRRIPAKLAEYAVGLLMDITPRQQAEIDEIAAKVALRKREAA